jgi:hypothetical protein
VRELNFKYYGGSETVSISTNASSVNFKVIPSEHCDWFTYTINPTSITVTAGGNVSFIDRTCRLTISNENGNSDYIDISQDGYRNMLVDLSLYVIIPYTHYIHNETFDLPIRIYGGNAQFKTDKIISDKIEQVYGNGNNYYNDFVFHIDQETEGTFTFIHSDRDEYLKYCTERGIKPKKEDLLKQIVVKQIDKETMDGYTVLSYLGKEYVNALPPMVTVNEATPTVIDIEYSCFFDSEYNLITDCEHEVKVLSDWVKSYYDKEHKKIYLKASGRSTISDRRCMMTVRNLMNPKQSYSTTVIQRARKL